MYQPDAMCELDRGRYVSTWELIVALRRCQHHLEVTMDQALQGMAMSFAQYRALELLARDGRPMHISWMARLLRLNRTSARETVRQLSQHRLVTTEREGRDRVIYLTDLAEGRLALCRQATAQVSRGLEQDLSDAQRATLTHLLDLAERAFTPPPPRVRPWWLE
jgi:DNA-binding MarR family transcriptional regulator